MKFSLAYLSVDQLTEPYRTKIEAIPTRLTLDAEQIDTTIAGARTGTLALPRLREYLHERVGTPRQ